MFDFKEICDALIQCDRIKVINLVQYAMDHKEDPQRILDTGLIT